MHAEQMIATHPHVRGEVNPILLHCIEACFDCAQICISCADACLGEEMVADLTQCIRLNLDCGDLCRATGAVATRRTGGDASVIAASFEACALACASCADECERHAERHEHCRICAEVCRLCESACKEALASLPATQFAH